MLWNEDVITLPALIKSPKEFGKKNKFLIFIRYVECRKLRENSDIKMALYRCYQIQIKAKRKSVLFENKMRSCFHKNLIIR